MPDPGKSGRAEESAHVPDEHGSGVGRALEERLRITGPADAARLLPPGLPELFDTAQLAEAAAIERRLAQQMTYCLRALGVLDTTGKRGNAIVYRRTDAT